MHIKSQFFGENQYSFVLGSSKTVNSTNQQNRWIPTKIWSAFVFCSRFSNDRCSCFLVAPYQHEQKTLLTMICNQQRIILLRNQMDRLQRWYSIIYERSNPPIQLVSEWHTFPFKSIGFTDHNQIYIFTDREFLIYSIDLSSRLHSCILLNDQNYHAYCHNIDLGYGGTVYGNRIYHIYRTLDQHWILSVLEFPTTTHLIDHDLTLILPSLTRIVNLSINARLISFLVLINEYKYAVLFCTHDTSLKIHLKKLIHLSYEQNPRSICSIYCPSMNKDIYFINDPSAKIIHLLTADKYLQSYTLMAHALYYIEQNDELLFVANDGIYSIAINEHQEFFSKFQ